jgi:hypothetical protein
MRKAILMRIEINEAVFANLDKVIAAMAMRYGGVNPSDDTFPRSDSDGGHKALSLEGERG